MGIIYKPIKNSGNYFDIEKNKMQLLQLEGSCKRATLVKIA